MVEEEECADGQPCDVRRHPWEGVRAGICIPYRNIGRCSATSEGPRFCLNSWRLRSQASMGAHGAGVAGVGLKKIGISMSSSIWRDSGAER